LRLLSIPETTDNTALPFQPDVLEHINLAGVDSDWVWSSPVAPRAIWKGYIKAGELICPVALYAAVSSSERVALHMLNRKTGHRLSRQFIDRETGEEVARDDQVKGYETGADEYIILEPEEIAAALPHTDKTLSILSFIPCDQADALYFDKPYYLAPQGAGADKVYAVLCEGLRKKKAAAIATAILFRRVRTVLIRPHDKGLIATTLNFDYEVRSTAEAFNTIAASKIKKEMLDLATHIIDTKRGSFNPSAFDDRYEEALSDLVKAKMEGRELKPPAPPAKNNVVDLMDALRQSAGAASTEKPAKTRRTAQKKPAGAKHEKKIAAEKASASKSKTSRRKAVPRKIAQRKAS